MELTEYIPTWGPRGRPVKTMDVSVHQALHYSVFVRILRTSVPRTFWQQQPFSWPPVVSSMAFYNSAYLYDTDSLPIGAVTFVGYLRT